MFIKQNIVLGLGYIMFCLLIGEVHPFTLVPMYSSFPSWAYSFYLSDDDNRLLPLANYFNCGDDALSHYYSNICERKHIAYGNQAETKSQLENIGEQMINQLQSHQYKSIQKPTIRLHRVCYFLRNNSITSTDIIMYERKWNE